MANVPLMFLSEWRGFPSAPCLAEGGGDLITARVSMLLKSRATPDMLPFSVCKNKRLTIRHMNSSLYQGHYRFPPTTSGSWSG